MAVTPDQPRDRTAHCAVALSRREQEVARLISFGLTNAAIAGRLEVGKKTIEKHVSHIFRKLRVTSRAQLIVYIVAPSSPYFEEMRREEDSKAALSSAVRLQ